MFGGLVEYLHFVSRRTPATVVRTQYKRVRTMFGGLVEYLHFVSRRAPATVVRTYCQWGIVNCAFSCYTNHSLRIAFAN